MAKGRHSQNRQAMMNAASLSGGSANSAAPEELRQRMLSRVVTMLKGLNFRTDFIMTAHLTDNTPVIFMQ